MLAIPSEHRWERWELSGPTRLVIGNRTFAIPLGSELKVRPPLVWVRVKDLVHVLSEQGDLDLTGDERTHYGEPQIWKRV